MNLITNKKKIVGYILNLYCSLKKKGSLRKLKLKNQTTGVRNEKVVFAKNK